MTLNPPKTVRAVIYILTAVGTPLVAYLNAKGIIGSLEVGLWSAEVAVANVLAAVNTSSRNEATLAVNAPADVDVRMDERGAGELRTALIVLGIIALVLLIVAMLNGGVSIR